MKKQILITMTMPMGLGGVERSLIGLLNSIDYTQYDVDLLLYAHHGELFKHIDKHVNLLPEKRELSCQNESILKKFGHGCFYAVILRLWQKIRKFDYIDLDRRILDYSYPEGLDKEYDVALGFFLPFNFINHKVRAKTKVGWIHTDYSYRKPGSRPASPEFLRKLYAGLDYIAAVSEDCRKAFLQVVPEFEKRTIVVENVLPAEFIKEQSLAENIEKEMPDNGKIKILSVGRFSPPKNFCSVPEICSGIIAGGYAVDWYLIGYGPEEKKIKHMIKQWNMEEHVHILGKKSNPYPYIRRCDLYAQPSNNEGKAVTVTEAQILGKVVVITDYATAHSQVNDGVDGIIVSKDSTGCAKGICELLGNNSLQQKLSDYCRNRDYAVDDVLKLFVQRKND